MPFDLAYPSHDYRSPRPGYRGTSLQSLFGRFPDQASCLQHVFETRFGKKPVCRRCGRPQRYYRRSGKCYFQNVCGDAISPLASTLFHASKLPLELWFYAMLHVANSAQGVSTLFAQRQFGIGYTAAVRVLRRIRAHLAAIEAQTPLGLRSDRIEIRLDRWRVVKGLDPGKTRIATVCMLADGQRVDSTVISRPRRADLQRLVKDKVASNKQPFTTCYQTYRAFIAYGLRPRGIDFLPAYYLDNTEVPDLIHGFLNYTKQSLKGQHRRVEYRYLWLYLKEFEFRFNRRLESQRIFWDMIGQFPPLDDRRIAELAAWHSR